jgi:competence protein ComEC
MNHFFAVIESWPNSTIKYEITGMEVFIIILIFFLIVLYLKTRRMQWAYVSVIFFSLFLIERSYSFSIFSLSPSIHFGIVEKKNHYIKFDYSRGKFDLYNINNTESCSGLASKEGIIRFKQKTVCVLSDKRWKKYTSTEPLLVDYLYITSDYKGHLDEIGKLFIAKKIILDSSLNPYQELLLIKECKRLNVDYISLSEKGTYKISV